MTAVIETRGLTKEYSGGRGVHQVDLAVGAGQVFGFLGPNGAGKSTFVKMLVGLLRPTSGEARVLGLPVGDLEGRKRMGYLPELFRFQDWLTAQEVLRFHARLCRMEGMRADKRIRAVIREVGLEGREGDRVRGFSKGMQQRLGLACALLPEPELLFLDEPASALDPGGRHEVRALLSRLRDDGITVFLNTHLLEDVESICSEVALLIDGEIRARGSVDEILSPEPMWEFTVGGWSPEVTQSLMETAMAMEIEVAVSPLGGSAPGGGLRAESQREGVVVLRARLNSVETAAWLNAQLVELGLSVYTFSPRRNRLESWFLTWTESQGREST